MEISIKLDLNDKYSLDYEVNINGEKFKINTTWVVQNDCQVYQLSRWIYEIHGIYGKKNRRNLVVGLCADHSHGYRGGCCKGKAKDAPLELIQLCLNSHCLLYYLEPVNNYSYRKRSIHKFLKDFLYDSHIIVVGVGIKEVIERLGKERGLFIKSRPKLAALAKEVLGEDMHFEKPNGLIWWSKMYYDVLSDDVVMYATIEAFLTCRIGSKLLRCSCE